MSHPQGRPPTAWARSAVVLALPLLLGVAWPDEGEWIPLTQAGLPLLDDIDVADPALDIGGPTGAAGAWYADDAHLMVRMRLVGEPGPTWAAPGRRYGLLLDLDGDGLAYELAAGLAADGLSLSPNTAVTRPDGWTDSPDRVDGPVDGDPAGSGRLSVIAAEGAWLLDLALPVDALEDLSYIHGQPFRLALVTDANGGGAFTTDLAGGAASGSILEDGLSDFIFVDADEDGLSLGAEAAAGTDPDDPDSDDDGINDGAELACSLGGSAEDRDDDGIPDIEEGTMDPDGDRAPAFCDADDDGDGYSTRAEGRVDSDGDGTPDHLDLDSDDDGRPDAEEPLGDDDCDGLRNRIDPMDADGPCGDLDGDGLDNATEAACGSDPTTADTDGDGQLDGVESCEDDADGDGIADIFDPRDDAGELDPAVREGEDQYGLTGGHFGGGGGCDQGGGSPALPLALVGLVALAGLRRRSRLLPLLVGLLALRPAAAQELDAQLHRPALGQGSWVSAPDARRSRPGPGVALQANQAVDPFVYRTQPADGNTVDVPILGRVGTLDLQAWWGLGRWRVGVDLPWHLQAEGQGINPADRQRLGDVAVDAALALLERAPANLALAATLRLSAPTGPERDWLGAPGPTAHGQLALSLGHTLQATAALGARVEPPSFVGDLALGSRLTSAVGAAWWPRPWGAAALELGGARILPAGDAPGATPVELTGSLRGRAGLGAGSARGRRAGPDRRPGAPARRLLLGLSFAPGALPTKNARTPPES